MAIERHGLSAGSQNALPRAGQEPGCAVTLAVARLYVSLAASRLFVICLPGPRRAPAVAAVSLPTLRGYIRDGSLFRENAASLVGL